MASFDIRSLPGLPEFKVRDIEELFRYDLSLPGDVYNALLQKDRKELVSDIEKLLQYASEQFEFFNTGNVPEENTFFAWHALLLLKDLKAEESLPAVLAFVKQDEELVSFYLGALITDYGWELYYVLAFHQLRLLTKVFKEIIDDIIVRPEILRTFQQVALRQPERALEIESYLHELLVFAGTRSLHDDAHIDEVTGSLLEVIGQGGFKNLYPEVKKALEENTLPLFFALTWQTFEQQYILEKTDTAVLLLDFHTREEINSDILNANRELDDNDYDYEEDDDLLETDAGWDEPEDVEDEDKKEEADKGYIDYTNIPYVKKEPDVGRNEPCPCGSGKKYKNCHGKS